jgi:hypothetical protein
MRATTKQFAEAHSIDYAVANGVVRFLKAKGLIKAVDNVKNSTGKGKSIEVYEFPPSVTIELTKPVPTTVS